MSGQTLQKIKPITDIASVVLKRLDEEASSIPLAYGSLKVEALAEILGGEARNPHWIGKGWKESYTDEDPTDPASVARALSANARKEVKVVSWGAIIDVPKGLSLLCASDPELKSWFSEIREKLAQTYMDELEKASVVRFGDGGSEKVPVSGLKGWWVGHAASAGGDPHMHIHLIISATAETIDGRRGQIDGKKLLNESAKLADGSVRRVLANEMAKIGLGFGLDGEVVGVDPEIIERASTGRNSVKAIQTYFAANDIPISDEQAWHHWRQICEGKADKGLPESLINMIKIARGEQLGGEQLGGEHFGGEAIEHAIDEAMSDPEKSKIIGKWLAEKYGVSDWDEMSKVAKKAWSEYPKYDDVTSVIALMATLPRAPKPEAVAGLCARFADDSERPELMAKVGADPRVLVGDKHWVLHSQLIREDEIRTRATKVLTTGSEITNAANPASDFPFVGSHKPSIDEQLTNTTGPALCVISGVAGGGKTQSLTLANKYWNDRGVRVWATARNRLTATETGISAGAISSRSLSTQALRRRIALGDSLSSDNENLRANRNMSTYVNSSMNPDNSGNRYGNNSNINARNTDHNFGNKANIYPDNFADIPMPGDVLVVDELGLLDHSDIEMILSLAESGVIVKALGDKHQIQPIDGSTSARLLIDVAQELGMATLDETKRCEPWREVHDQLRNVVTGEVEPEKVLDLLQIRPAEKIEEIIDIVNSFSGSEVVVQSNDLRCQIAQLLPRPEMEMLPGTDTPNVVMLRDSIAGWVGDEVVIRRNLKVMSPDGEFSQVFHNGQKGQIVEVNESSVVIKVNGYSATIRRDVAKDTLTLGGVHTGDSAQGQTFSRSVVVVTGMETREWLYSATTRGRYAPVIIALSETEDPRSVVEQVLLREGIAQTVDEMCKSDPTLAQSVKEVRASNSSDSGGPSDLIYKARASESASPEDIEPEPVEPEPVEPEPVEPEISDQDKISEPDIQAKPKPKVVSNKIFGTWDDEPIRVSDSPEKITPSPEQQVENWKKRKYSGGFFYKNDDGIWVVDKFKYDSVLWKMLGKGWSIKDDYFKIDKVRRIEPDSDEMYYPDLDPGPQERAAQEKAMREAAYKASQENGYRSSSSSSSSSYDRGTSKGRGGGGYGYGRSR